MKVINVVEYTLNKTSSGISADICAKSILCNSISEDLPFQAIELRNLNHLLLMLKDADFPHIYGEAGTFYFCAYYAHNSRYPVGRNYFIRETSLARIGRMHSYFKSKGLPLPIIPPSELNEKIEIKEYQSRVRDFKLQQAKETKAFRGLFEGRSRSLGIGKSIFLNSPGCLVCGNSKYQMMTSTVSSGNGLILGFNLCSEHAAIANSELSLLEYLAKLGKQPSPFQFVPLQADEHFELVLDWLPKELNCKIEKISDSTVTLLRPSGFKIIFRLDSLTNYAYMVFNPGGRQVARVDSANHHDIDYGPDHLHLNMTKKDRTVESSFTTGSPLVDTEKILQIIKQKEAESSKL
ncbi:hypothetical protein [Idiomarina abyssalis]|uniref:hypothetical protein n=1 Tax=Idiomarina abyssalis TaxID=86102 RepID=UPI001C983E12|nr:hypothetical protein [Idiomarina abyssalis]QZN90546.1 hypothetical protein K5X84_10335 [Idiomarina abyssalis]